MIKAILLNFGVFILQFIIFVRTEAGLPNGFLLDALLTT